MLFSDTFDAVARVAGISFRGGNEMANFIGTRDRRSKHSRRELDALTDFELMIHATFLSSSRI
jgi:hypothetical protein